MIDKEQFTKTTGPITPGWRCSLTRASVASSAGVTRTLMRRTMRFSRFMRIRSHSEKFPGKADTREIRFSLGRPVEVADRDCRDSWMLEITS